MRSLIFNCTFLGLAMGIMTASCSGDEPAPKRKDYVRKGEVTVKNVDVKLLNSYAEGLADATYDMTKVEMYNKDEWSDGKWELMDDMLVGYSYSTPRKIVFSGGKSWLPIKTFSSAEGPYRIGTALWLINYGKTMQYAIYTSVPIEVDADKKVMSLNELDYEVLEAEGGRLVLAHEATYWGGRTGNGGFHLDVAEYKKGDVLRLNEEYDLGFDSLAEAYDWVIERFRATFGEKVNLNYYYNAILMDPYFTVEDIIEEKERKTGKGI